MDIQVGDILKRESKDDPFSTFYNLSRQYGTLYFLVLDINYKSYKALQRTITTYKLKCINSGDIIYTSIPSNKYWSKE